MKKTLAWCIGTIALLCLVLAVVYWTVPAGSLPTYLPGYEPGVVAVHFKHGLAALIVGIALLIFVWFKTGKKTS